MENSKIWAELDDNNVCKNILWDSTGVLSPQDNLIVIAIDAEEGLSHFSGKKYVEGEWVDTRDYAEKRKAEYAQLNQFEMQFDDQRDGTTTWVDAINAIKAKFPK